VRNRRTAWKAIPLVALLLAACGDSPATPAAAPTSTQPSTTQPSTTLAPATTTSTRPATTTTARPAPATTSAPVTAPAGAAFTANTVRVTAADLPSSWRPGCPVAPADLRKLELTYWGFDSQPHAGALVVHASEADSITDVFRRLYERRFPIRRMELIDVYGGSDDASIAADNTSAFNCRNAVASGPPTWSAHAYGKAIDVNPIENPYILDGEVIPPAGAPFVDRANVRPGMAVRGGELNAAFAAAGWLWGGVWASPDYQHFSVSGN
jgi:hypothetical protein